MERVELKEISAKTTVKAIITGFVSYGIITVFMCLLIFALGNYFLSQFSGNAAGGLYITIPLLAAIMLYFIIHLICRISTYDVLKKCKVDPKNYKTITKSLNIFTIFSCSNSLFISFSFQSFLSNGFAINALSVRTINNCVIFENNEDLSF